MQRRESYVDIAKAFAIIAVVVGHIGSSFASSPLIPDLHKFIYIWHVPVFFMIGGFFLSDDRLLNPLSFIKGKFKSLYLPMIAIYLGVSLFHNLFFDWGWYSTMVDYGGKCVAPWTLASYLKQSFLIICLAGREPLLGAMWFVIVLFIALCGLSVISYIAKRWSSDRLPFEILRASILFALFLIAYCLSRWDILSVPRFNNSFTAMWLIYLGMLIRRWNISFDRLLPALIFAAVVVLFTYITRGVSLNENRFDGVVILSLTSFCALYAICYLSRRLTDTKVGNLMAYIGRDSFHIMAYHLIAFKVCTMLLNLIGYNPLATDSAGTTATPLPLDILTPDVGSNIFLWLIYLAAGTLLPLLPIALYRRLKK